MQHIACKTSNACSTCRTGFIGTCEGIGSGQPRHLAARSNRSVARTVSAMATSDGFKKGCALGLASAAACYLGQSGVSFVAPPAAPSAPADVD
eukprot:6638897-Alexandrium_andersonii.AAC.1